MKAPRSTWHSALGSLVLSLFGQAPAPAAVQAQSPPGLHEYAERGDVENVRRRIRAGRKLELASRRYHLRTPLHLAAENGHAPVVELLLEAGVDTGARTDRGFTPLHLAACGGRTDVIEILIAGGADRDARDDGGRSPLHLAALSGVPKALTLLLAGNELPLQLDAHDSTPLHYAVAAGQLECTKVLVSSVDELDQRDASGSTALHLASRGGDPKLWRLLLDEGADPDLRDLIGRTPDDVLDQARARVTRFTPAAPGLQDRPISEELERSLEEQPVIHTEWSGYCVGVAPALEGCDLAIWSDGVVLFSTARDLPNSDLRVGRVSLERLAFLWRELETTGVLEHEARELSGPGSTVRTQCFRRSSRNTAAGVGRYWLDPGRVTGAEDILFVHAYRSAARALDLALPLESWPLEDLSMDGVFRGYDRRDANAWLRARLDRKGD